MERNNGGSWRPVAIAAVLTATAAPVLLSDGGGDTSHHVAGEPTHEVVNDHHGTETHGEHDHVGDKKESGHHSSAASIHTAVKKVREEIAPTPTPEPTPNPNVDVVFPSGAGLRTDL